MSGIKGTGISRIVVLKNFNKLIAGRDMDEVLKPGVVYSIREVMGVIMLEEIGESAQKEIPSGRKFSSVMMEGCTYLTKEEYAAQIKKEKEDRE